MHTPPVRHRVALALATAACFASLVTPVVAQQPAGPAAELKALQPLVGNWHGEGQMNGPGGKPSKWQARGTYRWALDNHFLREDFLIRIEGMPQPMVIHGYLGFDRQTKRYVHLQVTNAGKAQVVPMTIGADGSMLVLSLQQQNGVPYAERSRFTVRGDTLLHTVDLLLAEGPQQSVVDGKFTRGGDAFDAAFDTAPFLPLAANEAMTRLGRSIGDYEVEGTVAAPQGEMKFTGTDRVRTLFGGSVVHVHTEGSAAGTPGKFVGEVFWARDEALGCIAGHYVSNGGELMSMQARWLADGQLLTTAHGLWGGVPMLQRTAMSFDAKGALVGATSHALFGTAAPYESYRATYSRQQ